MDAPDRKAPFGLQDVLLDPVAGSGHFEGGVEGDLAAGVAVVPVGADHPEPAVEGDQ